ncbi:hypothetical protein SHELI_v1c01040 [Spiroplasma helicoides]|uniref:RDD domain-containing protein n=1 Tax=Spiroplasma helicoides TaxID=216938 RepID=A0A1B3SJF4_9MOLU|nr:RDD family protein [Spiroplasma helicoides]AOG60059.1 hypothetical protein SHELI_v1c01040 [Spiroplasma helicoides]
MSNLKINNNNDKVVEEILELKTPHLGRVFFARLFDLLFCSIPTIFLFFFYPSRDWSSAFVSVAVNLLVLFFYLVVLSFILKGNSFGKLIFNLRIKKSDEKKLLFRDVFYREIYYVFIPTFIQIFFQIIIILVFQKVTNEGKRDEDAENLIILLQNLSYLFYFCWYLYICITIVLQKNHLSSIDIKRNTIILHKLKTIKINKKIEEPNESHIHLDKNRPGIVDLNDLVLEDEDDD